MRREELINDYLRRLKALKGKRKSQQAKKEIEQLKIELDYIRGKISLEEYYKRMDEWREKWKKRETAKRVNKPFPHGDILPKNKELEFKIEPIVPKEFWNKRKDLAEWGKREAQQLYRKLKPLEGQYVVLTGGGWSYPSPSYIVKLEKVEIDHPTYYRNNKTYKRKTRWIVIAHLRWGRLSSELSGRDSFPGGDRVFSPRLGSWRIYKIEANKK